MTISGRVVARGETYCMCQRLTNLIVIMNVMTMTRTANILYCISFRENLDNWPISTEYIVDAVTGCGQYLFGLFQSPNILRHLVEV
jgi:hypothetical protein